MIVDHQPDSASARRQAIGSPAAQPGEFFRERPSAKQPQSAQLPAEEVESAPLQPTPEEESSEVRKTAGNGRASFGLDAIRTVAFRCGQCQTTVRFPRIRWANFPESCPNCGAEWMREPSPQNPWPEDKPTYVFRVLLAFREALQALAGMERSNLFSLLLEMDDTPNPGKIGHAKVVPNDGSSHA